MTRKDQHRFVKELINNVRKDLLERVSLVPEAWEGRELRQWIADRFQEATMHFNRDKRRARRYRQAVLEHNL